MKIASNPFVNINLNVAKKKHHINRKKLNARYVNNLTAVIHVLEIVQFH